MLGKYFGNRKDNLMKKNELEILINGFRNLSEEAAKIAIALAGLDEDPVSEKVYTYEEVREFLGNISKDHRDKIKTIISNHGETSLSSYKDKPDILAAIMKEAEVIANA